MLQISERMSEPTLDSMTFLNEVVGRYPKAISFAPGRPSPELFGVEKSLDLLRKHAPAILGRPDIRSEEALDEIAQYGRTNGIVHHHVARQLLQDEGLELDPDQLVITNGCQEAMLLLLLTLFTPPRDVLLATEPVYLGITAAARLLGIEVVPIRLRPDGPDLEELAAVVQLLRQQGKVPRALYTIPDFDNPSGYTTSLATRQHLCVLARRNNLLLLEDTPYRMLRFESEPLPLLKAIDPEQVVLLGSYSKTIFPGLRLGFLSGDVEVSLAGRAVPLSQIVSKAKSLTSVNTSPLMQATLASVLIENDHSLRSHAVMLSAHYREKRDALLRGDGAPLFGGPECAAGSALEQAGRRVLRDCPRAVRVHYVTGGGVRCHGRCDHRSHVALRVLDGALPRDPPFFQCGRVGGYRRRRRPARVLRPGAPGKIRARCGAPLHSRLHPSDADVRPLRSGCVDAKVAAKSAGDPARLRR